MSEIIKEGLLHWIDDSNKYYKSEKDSINITGVVAIENSQGNELVFCTSTSNNKYSSIFSYNYTNCFIPSKDPCYYGNSLLKITKNYQAITKCNNYVIASTSLEDNVYGDLKIIYWKQNDTCNGDKVYDKYYNKILYPTKPNLMHLCNCDGCDNSSKCIKNELLNITQSIINCSCYNINYFKLEGITCIEKYNFIIFGISNIGKCKHSNINKALLIRASYIIKDSKICIERNFTVMVDYDLKTIALCNRIDGEKACELSLSDICYDKEKKNMLILTKYELLSGKTGGFLWITKWFDEFYKIGYALTLIKTKYISYSDCNCKCTPCKCNISHRLEPLEWDTSCRGISCLGNSKVIVTSNIPYNCKSLKFFYKIINYSNN